MLEEERKYDVDPTFPVPELGSALPAGGQVVALRPASLRATYYDTPDRRLARAGVSVMDGRTVRLRFREIEVGRHQGGVKLLDRVDAILRGAGAVAGTFTAKHLRAMGPLGPPDLVPPAGLGKHPTAGQVVTGALR